MGTRGNWKQGENDRSHLAGDARVAAFQDERDCGGAGTGASRPPGAAGPGALGGREGQEEWGSFSRRGARWPPQGTQVAGIPPRSVLSEKVPVEELRSRRGLGLRAAPVSVLLRVTAATVCLPRHPALGRGGPAQAPGWTQAARGHLCPTPRGQLDSLRRWTPGALPSEVQLTGLVFPGLVSLFSGLPCSSPRGVLAPVPLDVTTLVLARGPSLPLAPRLCGGPSSGDAGGAETEPVRRHSACVSPAACTRFPLRHAPRKACQTRAQGDEGPDSGTGAIGARGACQPPARGPCSFGAWPFPVLAWARAERTGSIRPAARGWGALGPPALVHCGRCFCSYFPR